jgi:tetratricopeptide (TPR) repeat protein
MTFKTACLAALVVGGFTLGLTTLSSLPARAAGSDEDATPTCKTGEVYDKKLKKCVTQSGANITDENRADYAYSLAKDGRYDEALAMLDTVKNQDDPEVLNYRGYATRKLGRTDEGISYYLRSVAAAPKYAKVREYLGEAYVIKGRVDLAQDQLKAIRSICGTTCTEYQELNAAIRDPSTI